MPDIALWNKCDNKCVMCTNTGSFALQDSGQYRLKCQIEKLERHLGGQERVYLKNGGDSGFISLTGGEPTLHPDFFQLLAYFRRRLPRAPITLLSNGRRFSDRKFAERFAAAEAYRIGLLHEIVPDEETLDEAVGEIVEALLKNSPNALKECKDLIRAVASRPLTPEVVEDTAQRICRLRASDEGREGMSAFLEKRKPNWVIE